MRKKAYVCMKFEYFSDFEVHNFVPKHSLSMRPLQLV